MTTIAPNSLDERLASVAAAAAGTLASGEALTAQQPTSGIPAVTLPAAVVVPFAGALTGEFAVFVDEELSTALSTANIGSLDLAAALAPALQAIGGALDNAALGVAQALDARMASSRIAGHAASGSVALTGSTGVRAVVAVGFDNSTNSDAGPARGAGFDRFDLLRGVEMQASVELGRAKVTVNELLSLRSGEVIELDRGAGEAADLYVNGRLIARGEIVVVDENYGLRITELVNDEIAR
jgi:flagellar motor switch protein FliN/FliY